MPSVSSLSMDPAVAALAERDQVAVLICPTLRERHNVVDFLHRDETSFLEAELTEGMALDVSVADDLPVLPVPALRGLTVTPILFISCVHLLLVFLTVPTVSQAGTTWIRTWFLWFAWHVCLLSGITKAPEGFLRGSFSCSYNITFRKMNLINILSSRYADHEHHIFPNRRTVNRSSARFLRL